MNEREYKELQDRFSKKIKPWPTNKEASYNEAILACKSILKEIFDKQKGNVK